MLSKGQILVSAMGQYKGEGIWSADMYRPRKALISISWVNLKDVKEVNYAYIWEKNSQGREDTKYKESEEQVYLVFLKRRYEGRMLGAEWGEENAKKWERRRSTSLPILRTLVFILSGHGEPLDGFKQMKDTIWLVLKILILATLRRRDYRGTRMSEHLLRL